MVFPRGLAPRISAFARRRVELLHFGSLKLAAASGIAPDSPRLQRGADLSQLHSLGRPIAGEGKFGGAPGTRTPDTIAGATVFKTAPSTNRTRSFHCKMAPWRGLAPRRPV